MLNYAFSHDSYKSYKETQEHLQVNLKKLEAVSLPSEFGLSEIFHKHFNAHDTMALACEKAMEQLAEVYVQKLVELEHAVSATEALSLLNDAESIWEESASVIRKYDSEGTEKAFLLEMRQQALVFLEDQLAQAGKRCERIPSKENVTLCLGLLAVIDYILEECGEPSNSPKRKRYRETALKFR
ncbi:MAG: hypothetical protein K0S74_549 [Chlamydiales bacterium]|jgi:hypothetical protein|nr:hypothetical protein [Chlamydiales bacterium]